MSYAIGTQYLSLGKHPNLCTILDILTTRNSSGELVSTRYLTSHEFCGQQVVDATATDVTVARGIWKLGEASKKETRIKHNRRAVPVSTMKDISEDELLKELLG